jgi:hypothetical protein
VVEHLLIRVESRVAQELGLLALKVLGDDGGVFALPDTGQISG